MWRQLPLMVLTGLVLTLAYGGYALFVSPVLKPPDMTRSVMPVESAADTQRPAENLRVASTWLADRPWTSEAKYYVRTDEMFLYTDQWVPNGKQKQVRFRPFAAVWLMKDKQGVEQAVTITADSALLAFENFFEIDAPKPGRITGGTMNGDVRITGPDGLEILGDNFTFSEGTQSLYSQSQPDGPPIRFRFGPNHGEAQLLTMKLVKGDKPAAKDRPNIVGIEHIALSNNVKMELLLQDSREEVPVRVGSKSLIYMVEARTATFEEYVKAYRYTDPAELQYDQLNCHRLTVGFEPKAPPPGAEPAAATPRPEIARRNNDEEFRRIDTNLQFRSLKAEGSSKGSVVLVSQKYGLNGKMSRLDYDAQRHTIALSASTEKPVDITQGSSRLLCPDIELTMGMGQELKDVICRGAGKLWNRDPKSGQVLYAADWMKQLRKYTDPESGLDVIELEQDASFRQSAQETALAGNLIRLWLTPLAAAQGGEFNLAAPGDAKPKKLLATGDVVMLNPKFEAETNHLEVTFEDVAAPAAARGPGKSKSAASAGKEAAKGKAAPESKDDEPQSPSMFVKADGIRVRMLQRPDQQEPELAKIETKGHVQVEQATSDPDKPLIVTGERLDVEQHGENDQQVSVYGEPGRPAHVRDELRQLHIEGPTIHLSREENRAWVEGAGLLQLPVPKSLDGKDLPAPMLLDVWWRDGMNFDGLTADFRGNVRAKLDTGTMQCQLMQVSLSERIRFTQDEGPRATPEIKAIVCREGVDFENKVYLEGLLMEIQQAQVWEFTFDHQRDTTFAQGPGWMQMWRRGNGKRAGLAMTETVQANHAEREPTAEWEYTRVEFAKNMTGQIARRSSTFHERVQVMYGPVERPLDAINRHKLPKFGGHMECDKLDVAQTVPDDGGKAFVQLFAAGNSRIEANEFDGRADSISFDESKDLYVLRSNGHGKATIWRQTSPGAPLSESAAQQIDFIPSQGRIKFSKSIGGAGAN